MTTYVIEISICGSEAAVKSVLEMASRECKGKVHTTDCDNGRNYCVIAYGITDQLGYVAALCKDWAARTGCTLCLKYVEWMKESQMRSTSASLCCGEIEYQGKVLSHSWPGLGAQDNADLATFFIRQLYFAARSCGKDPKHLLQMDKKFILV